MSGSGTRRRRPRHHQAIEPHLEGRREPEQRANRGVLLAVLEAADVGAVEPRLVGELLLRPATCGSQFLHAAAEALEVVLGRIRGAAHGGRETPRFLHAGAIASVADSANGYAAYTLAPPDTDVLAVEFKINLLEPARASGFLARARVLRGGRTLSVCQADVFTTEPDARLVAIMTSTIIIRPLRRG